MSGLHPAKMRPADKRGDPYIADALAKGYLDSGQAYIIRGFPGHELAVEGRTAVNRSSRRQNIGPACWIADEAGERCGPKTSDCAALDAPHQVHFKLWSKDRARDHVFRESGGDPNRLKYNPWAGRTRRLDDSGQF